MQYAIWRACERFNIDPDAFPTLPKTRQEDLIAYNQVREHEEADVFNRFLNNLIKVMSKR